MYIYVYIYIYIYTCIYDTARWGVFGAAMQARLHRWVHAPRSHTHTLFHTNTHTTNLSLTFAISLSHTHTHTPKFSALAAHPAVLAEFISQNGPIERYQSESQLPHKAI